VPGAAPRTVGARATVRPFAFPGTRDRQDRSDAGRGARRRLRWCHGDDRRLRHRRDASALIDALIAQGARDLTVVNNNAGNADFGLALLLKAKRVRKIICSFPRQMDSWHFDTLYRAGKIELELVAQGNLAERIRAAGAGIGAFFTPTGYGTLLAEGKETRVIEGRPCVLEYPIHAISR